MKTLLERFRQLRSYPTAVIGLIIIALLVIVSVVTPFIMPYNEAIRLWRGGEDIWAVSYTHLLPLGCLPGRGAGRSDPLRGPSRPGQPFRRLRRSGFAGGRD